ncbi:hypothetical protein D3C79_961800 [compost metagenome]
MQRVNCIAGEAFEQSIFHHPQRPTQGLFGRLEDQIKGAVEGFLLGKIARRTEQYRGMPVMATGVHLAWVTTLVG